MDKIVLEIKVPKNSEETPEAMSALYAGLLNYRAPWWRRLVSWHKCISFEIALIKQTIHFYVVAEEDIVPYLVSQVLSQYPRATYLKVKDYLPEFNFKNAVYGSLKLSSIYYYPLRTYKEFKDIDPLSSLLGTLAKAGPDDQAVFQMVINPAPLSYDSAARRSMENGLPSLDGKHNRPLPQASLITKKIAERAFHAGLKLVAVSTDKAAAKSFLLHLAGGFGNLNLGEGNSLVLRRQYLLRDWFRNCMLKRSFRFIPSYQYLNLGELATLFHFPSEKLAKIKNISWAHKFLGEPPESLPVAANLTEEEKKDVNFFARTEYKNQPTVYGVKKRDRRKHVYVIGKTGTGKTTLIANMAINDIRNQEGLAVIDPHGDLTEILLDYIPSYRLNDVVYLDPSDIKHPFYLNVLEVNNKEQMELVVSGIVAIFQKLYAYSWGPRLEYILRNVMLTLVQRPGSTLVDVPFMLSDDNFRQKVVEKCTDPIMRNFWNNEFAKMHERLRSEAISPILNKVGQFVSSPMIRNIIGHPHSTINLEKFMNEGKIVLVNLSQGKLGEDNATLLGAMIITKMQLAAMNRVYQKEEERRDFYLYVDEFQNFATKSFIKILSEARKYRLNLTVANQYIGQLEEEVIKAIFGNVGTLMSFLVGAQDAYHLSREFGKIYTEEDLVKIGNYEIINKLSIDNLTSPPFYASTLPLPNCRTQNREKAIRLSTERYTKVSEVAANV
jgi:hypothetical protein